MTLSRINALRDLDYKQLVNLAIQRNLFTEKEVSNFWRLNGRAEWSPDRLRLKLIDAIVDEELQAQRETPPERTERVRQEGEAQVADRVDFETGDGRR